MKFKLEIQTKNKMAFKKVTILLGMLYAYVPILYGQVDIGSENDSCRIYHYSNGFKRSELCYKKGKLNGIYKSFYINGNIEQEGYLNNGKKEGSWIFWYPDSNKSKEGFYKGGKKNGEWIYWDSTGNIFSKGNYIDNNKIGPWVEYYSNGKISASGIFEITKSPDYIINRKSNQSECVKCADKGVFSLKSGEWKEYHENGQVKSIGNYLPKGICSIRTEKIFNEETGSYFLTEVVSVNYIKDGLWRYYDEQGNLSKEERYKKGRVKKPTGAKMVK